MKKLFLAAAAAGLSLVASSHTESEKIEVARRMAGCDTNRYARILRELAVENTNETKWAIASLGRYKTTESPPVPVFLRHERSLRRKGVEGSVRHRGCYEQLLICGAKVFFHNQLFPAGQCRRQIEALSISD